MGYNNYSRVFSGASIVFIGIVFELGIGFAAKALLARVATAETYGIVIYAHTVVIFLAVLVVFGFDSGIGRYVPRYDSQHERRGLIVSIVALVVPLAALTGLALYLLAGVLSSFIFDTSRYAVPFRVLATAIPLFVFIRIAIGGIRGMKQSIGMVAVKNVTLPMIRFLLIGAVAVLGGGVAAFAGAYVLSYAVGGIAVLYFLNQAIPLFSGDIEFSRKQVVAVSKFSAPLVLSTAVQQVISRADLLMVGYFRRSASMVGAYDVSLSLAQLLLAVVTGFGYIAMPVISELDATGNMTEIRTLYSLVVKWCVLATVPLILLFLFFPITIISVTFGLKYLSGALPLQILSVAFLTHIVIGPSGNLLKSLGKSRQLMTATVVAGVTNVCFNLVLIPTYGTAGAASATLISYIVMNAIVFFHLNRSGIPPATSSELHTVGVPVVTFSTAYAVATFAVPSSDLVTALLTSTLFGCAYLAILVRYIVGGRERELLLQLSEEYDIPIKRIDLFFQKHGKRYNP